MGIIKQLNNFNINHNKKMVELHSFLRNCKISNNPKNYNGQRKLIQDNCKFFDDKKFIDYCSMLKILKNSRKNESREIYKDYFKKYAIKYDIDKKNEEDKNIKNNKKEESKDDLGKATFDNINNLDGNNSFRFDGKVVKYIKIDSDKIYFKGADVAKALKYSDPDQEIRNKVSEKYKKSFENIKTRINHRTQKTINEKKSTVFITETGLYSLIMKSKNRIMITKIKLKN
jgi:hypothetical protein